MTEPAAAVTMLEVHIPDANLSVDELERVIRHLDQLWATLAQVIAYLLRDRTPTPRSQVRRPLVGWVGLQPPHSIGYLDSDPPAPPPIWDAYRRVLADPDRAGRQLARCVDKRRGAWSAAERERRDLLLYAAVAPSGSSRKQTGGLSMAEGVDLLPRLARRVELHALRLQQSGVRTL